MCDHTVLNQISEVQVMPDVCDVGVQCDLQNHTPIFVDVGVQCQFDQTGFN